MLFKIYGVGALCLAIAFSLVLGPVVTAPDVVEADAGLTNQQGQTLNLYAKRTWASMVAMTDAKTGLSADNINADTRARSGYTSPTNIAAYIWSTLAARDLHLITAEQAQSRISRTLDTLARLERHEASGMYYNWYSPSTGEKLTVWPVDQSRVYPFLSSVDNGWLAASLIMVRNAVPALSTKANAIYETFDFGFYYDSGAGLLRGGFWDEPSNQCNAKGNYRQRGADVYYTCHHYGSLNTEPRIASYIGIAEGDVPATHYYKLWRTFPSTCDWGWQEMKPDGVTKTYLGVDVYEGHYTYRDKNIVPSWGGSMFEALMVPLFVPEEEWGPRSWGVNHPLYVEAQIEHGMNDANYGYWGFSPSNDPAGGYREYGVDELGLNPDGYSSDQERTTVDYGFGECRPEKPLPAEYGKGVVTPHASFLALDYEPEAALKNLHNLRENHNSFQWGGFYDAIDVRSGQQSKYYLALDQGMIIPAIANKLNGNKLQDYFTKGKVEQSVRPLLEAEEFTAGRTP